MKLHERSDTPQSQRMINIMGVGTNFGVGVEEARPEGPGAGIAQGRLLRLKKDKSTMLHERA